MSTVAAFLALTGGATAIAMSLPKNSVTAKQLAKGAVKEAKIAKGAVTGSKIKASTFPQVPSAAKADTATTATNATTATTATTATNAAHADVATSAGHADSAGRAESAGRADSAATADTATTAGSADALGGTPASAFPKEQTTSSDFFTEPLEISVPGYGTFGFLCNQGETSNNGDDKLHFRTFAGPIEGAPVSGVITTQELPGGFGNVTALSGTASPGASLGLEARFIHVQYEATVVGTNKTLMIQAGGWDNTSNPGCAAQIHAFTTG
jgi:hypothetical protein